MEGKGEGRHTFENSHGSGVVVYSSCGSKGSGYDGWRGHEVVGEGVVEITL